MQNLALLDEVFDRAGDILNRHGGIDTVLIVEVDTVGSQPLSDSSTTFLICTGRLSSAIVPSILNPNLLAITTFRGSAQAPPRQAPRLYMARKPRRCRRR